MYSIPYVRPNSFPRRRSQIGSRRFRDEMPPITPKSQLASELRLAEQACESVDIIGARFLGRLLP